MNSRNRPVIPENSCRLVEHTVQLPTEELEQTDSGCIQSAMFFIMVWSVFIWTTMGRIVYLGGHCIALAGLFSFATIVYWI